MKEKFSLLVLVCLAIFLMPECDFIDGTQGAADEGALVQADGSSMKIMNFNTIPNDFCGVTQIDLWAGVGNPASATLVGYVELSPNLDGTLHVRYVFDEPALFPYFVTSIHFDIGASLNDIPRTKSGNPVPGQFDYNFTVSPETHMYEFDVVLPELPAGQDNYIVAAHASVVQYGGVTGFEMYLPNGLVGMTIVKYPATGDPSYFQVRLTNAGFISLYDMDGSGPMLPGTYYGWCVDTDNVIYLNVTYQAYLYSSTETIPAGVVENPQNFDLVNYLINNFVAGQLVQVGVDIYGNPIMQALTYGDIQRAIWALIDDGQSTSGLGPWSQARVNIILAQTYANGEGFLPACNQKIALVSVPVNNVDGNPSTIPVQIIIAQPTIAEVQVPCQDTGKTAWADGYDGANFPGAKQWGTWFQYETECGL